VLQALSDEVGPGRTLLVCCAAFRGDAGRWPNLTIKKIPKMVLQKCEWGHDDYSLNVENLPIERSRIEAPSSAAGATDQLKTYLSKGVLLDDERFKRGDDAEYFEELLARIRDIRSSEKVFWRKVLDIYATSMDYDPNTETSKQFFATVQNKMHWAAHGHTAAELIVQRVDAQAPNMGLTHWTGANRGAPIRKADVGIAKNYLNAEELDTLNRIVTAYIEVAELQAQARQPMTMRDWAQELDNFLRLTRKDILTHAGKVSAETALAKAQAAYVEYRTRVRDLPTRVDKDFEDVIAQPVKQLQKSRKALPNKKKGDQA
jgi:hypothetical protein